MVPKKQILGRASRCGVSGVGLMELILVLSVLSVLATVAIPSLLSSKRKSSSTSTEAWLKTLNQAEDRLSLKGMSTNKNWSPAATIFRYKKLGILSSSSWTIPRELAWENGRWILSVDSASSSPAPSFTSASFDEDPEILWESFHLSLAAGSSGEWLESAPGGSLESMFVYLENSADKTSFVHLTAGPPAARMYMSAFSPAVAKQIAESFREPVLAQFTYENLPENVGSYFAESLHPLAQW